MRYCITKKFCINGSKSIFFSFLIPLVSCIEGGYCQFTLTKYNLHMVCATRPARSIKSNLISMIYPLRIRSIRRRSYTNSGLTLHRNPCGIRSRCWSDHSRATRCTPALWRDEIIEYFTFVHLPFSAHFYIYIPWQIIAASHILHQISHIFQTSCQ